MARPGETLGLGVAEQGTFCCLPVDARPRDPCPIGSTLASLSVEVRLVDAADDYRHHADDYTAASQFTV